MQDLATKATSTPDAEEVIYDLAPVRSAMLSQLAGFEHGFYGRVGGVSSGIYESLNSGPGSQDDPANVAENRRRIATHLGVSPDRLLSAYQVHGADALLVDGPFQGERPQVDALVTRCPSIAPSVLTADCAPVLFADPAARIVAAAHAGWKGALGGILEATLARMIKLGGAPGRIVAAIGPCIAQASYEVGPEFVARFVAADPANERFFIPGEDDRSLFDLKRYCAARLRAAGLGAVDILPHDTCAETSVFFSNRRRNLAGEADYGRNLSAIRIAR
ncbi:laccase domain protein YfiH [Candidatus Phycosocius bacilliformis]|uniref:Purine nucleoside phosphorylase n=1 Tax=Candidatus Phycosocius bacilliformis TaxID=1445552 RepID=A0A2P2EAP3_9PROT|nr:peptidoglycan editing factor PgeF [Candidatus Phycosocius bacilliformis]GBF58099.1 laccase domain protein YfiH [Candidatus Phycosocius bacilliformis]